MSDVGIVSAAVSANVSGTTLLDLAGAIAEELGGYKRFSTTSTATATNVFISTELADSEAPTSRYAGWYAYVRGTSATNPHEQQRVKRAGFAGTTGTFTTAAGYGLAMPSGMQMELHGVMPRISADGLIGIRECINRALRKLWVVDRYHLTGVASQEQYALGALWWASKDRFIRLLDPPATAGSNAPPSRRRWDIRNDGEQWYLELAEPFSADDDFSLIVERPTNSRLKQSGTWGEQSSPTAGFVSDDDACLGEWNTLFQCGLYECIKALTVQAGGARKGYWRERLAEQRMVVSAIKLYEMESEDRTLGEGQSDVAVGDTDDGTKGLWSSF